MFLYFDHDFCIAPLYTNVISNMIFNSLLYIHREDPILLILDILHKFTQFRYCLEIWVPLFTDLDYGKFIIWTHLSTMFEGHTFLIYMPESNTCFIMIISRASDQETALRVILDQN